ncbi:MAG: SUMF1/EgtB/PvdO family nonheme iron enzyme [Planctomycetes bacterium]|nr:SUMF1/EgtB/PvdO family nonheme iron enzyme [Planctomycetota bacterium]
MNALRFTRFAAALVVALSVTAAHAQAIDWVTVGDPGNAADTSGYGAVAATFQIMKYEFTNQQYTNFLNSVAATDNYSLYDENMANLPRGGILRSGSSGSYTYSVKPNMGDKPVNYITWFDAARVANWYQNGATSSSSTETGAYTLSSGTTIAPAVNAGATFYIPTEDQWYKAAYYKGGGTSAGYWTYATQSNTAPTAVTSGSTGIGSAGNTGNFANYAKSADWNGQDGNVTTVGTNGGASAYGAFDMNGNLYEWNDLTGAAGPGRQVRGGDWDRGSSFLSSASTINASPAFVGVGFGFRLAGVGGGPSGVPEIDPATGSSALSVVAGVLAMVEQRRRRAKLVA